MIAPITKKDAENLVAGTIVRQHLIIAMNFSQSIQTQILHVTTILRDGLDAHVNACKIAIKNNLGVKKIIHVQIRVRTNFGTGNRSSVISSVIRNVEPGKSLIL